MTAKQAIQGTPDTTAIGPKDNFGPAEVRQTKAADLPAILQLHRRAFGPGRFALTAYRIREGTPPISQFCRVSERDGTLIAAVRMTEIEVGGTGGALLLGPLAVEPQYVNKGYGRQLIASSLAAAREKGLQLVILVGNSSYYGKFGFVPVPRDQIVFPGPVDPGRILAFELAPGAIARFHGPIRAIRTDQPDK
ncbi:MAG: N-acetyltransferase [Alphaproteobacteria bacterium]|nr:N-acetyltransferase [Alphaproteobacteria bacterium]